VATFTGTSAGVAKGVAAGAATITATQGSVSGTAALTVTAPGPQIQSQFFGMSTGKPSDPPKVSYGTLGHTGPFAWTIVEGAARGTYNWNELDTSVLSAPRDANGTALFDMTLGYTPGWAVQDQSSCRTTPTTNMVVCTVAPDNIQDWRDFVTALVNRYNGITKPHVKYYEIWNEANETKNWSGGIPALVSLAQAAYPILKQDPYSFVLTPSVVWGGTQNGVAFDTSYLNAGGSSYADGLTFHSYPSTTGCCGPPAGQQIPLPESAASTNAPVQTMIAAFRQVADTNGMQGKPIMSTEGGWGIMGVSDPDMQAAWIAHWLLLSGGFSLTDNYAFVVWYAWGINQQSGDIETAQGTPTQAGYAYSQVYNWLVGQQTSPCSNSGNIWSCAVSSSLAVWDYSQTCNAGTCTSSTYTPPAGYSKFLDLTGAVNTINGSINLGVKPILLEP
jgi:hypothetical protein